jgi:hypothetical protein
MHLELIKQLNHPNQIPILFKTIQLTVFMEILLVVKMTRQLKQREA